VRNTVVSAVSCELTVLAEIRTASRIKRGLQDLLVGCALAKDGLTTLPPGPEGTLVGKVRQGCRLCSKKSKVDYKIEKS